MTESHFSICKCKTWTRAESMRVGKISLNEDEQTWFYNNSLKGKNYEKNADPSAVGSTTRVTEETPSFSSVRRMT